MPAPTGPSGGEMRVDPDALTQLARHFSGKAEELGEVLAKFNVLAAPEDVDDGLGLVEEAKLTLAAYTKEYEQAVQALTGIQRVLDAYADGFRFTATSATGSDQHNADFFQNGGRDA